MMNPINHCPITGVQGIPLRKRTGQELAADYASYLGAALPSELVEKYFMQAVQEYECAKSGLRWYAPTILGESDYYEWLTTTFPWYYSPTPTWDKITALELLLQADSRGFVEIGSGSGVFLKLALARGVAGIGTEINEQAIRTCKAEGLEIYHADENPAPAFSIDTLVSLQSLEHMADPLTFLSTALKKFPVTRAIIAVPCFDALLGHTLDPLAWPPHHFTSWSGQAFATMAPLLGYRLETICYEPLFYDSYRNATDKERTFPNSELRRFPQLGPLSAGVFKIVQRFGPPWLSRRHSLIAVLRRSTS